MAILFAVAMGVPRGEPVDFERINVGDNGPSSQTFLVIRDSVQWGRLWNLTFECPEWGATLQCPYSPRLEHAPEIPSIEFSSQMVIGVFWPGLHPGYEIRIQSLERHSDDSLDVHVYETYPDPCCAYPQVTVYPKHVIVTEMVKGEVNFIEHKA